MKDADRERAILHGLEGDWRETLEAMRTVQDAEVEEVRDRLKDMHRGYRRLAIWQVLNSIALLAVVVGGLAFQSNKNAATASALCALRHDVEVRVAQGDAFLREHPQGAFGIPAATIAVQVDGQRRTVMALSGLRCGQ